MRTDFLTDENGDLQIEDGDFITGASDDQHIQHLLQSTIGTIKDAPLLGVGIVEAISGVVDGSTKRKIDINLKADGYTLRSIASGKDKLKIDYASGNNS
jgi:hypothetical protein